MPRFLCPGFETLSEFIPSSSGETSHGDCGWLALLLALHCYDAGRYPLTGDGLASVRDDAIRNGYAEANGAVNIPNLDRYLTDRHIPHTTVGYDQYTLDDLHTLLKSYATGFLQPVIIECSSAGRLPEDEADVQFHYFTTGGIDTDIPCYFRGDGDAVKYNAWPGFKDPIQTSWDEIVASAPIGWIVIHGAPGAPIGGTHNMAWHQQPDGSGKDDNGNTCGAGLMVELRAAGYSANGLSGETYAATFGLTIPGTESWLPLADDRAVFWSGSAAGGAEHGGQALHALAAALDSANGANQVLQKDNQTLADQLKQAQQQPQANPVDHQIAVGLKSLVDLSAQVK